MIQPVVQSLYLPGTLLGGEKEAQSADSRARDTDAATQQQRTPSAAFGKELSAEEQKQIEDLKRIDRNVRSHEAAHQAAAGGLARGVSFTYQPGPDGKQYAVGGEVQIDTAPVEGNPQATIAKAQRIRAAANAPADPSAQDRQVAAQAGALEAQARLELQEQARLELQEQAAEVEEVESPEQTEQTQQSNPSDSPEAVVPNNNAQHTEHDENNRVQTQTQRSAAPFVNNSADVIRQFTSPFGYQQQGVFFNAQA